MPGLWVFALLLSSHHLLLLFLSQAVATESSQDRVSSLSAAVGRIEIPLLEDVSVLLLAHERKQVVVRNINQEIVSVVTHVYTREQNVTVSPSKTFPADSSYTSSSAGVVTLLRPAATKVSFYLRGGDKTLSARLFAVPYTAEDPVPGTCNTEFILENDPNVHLTYNVFETIVMFAPANLGAPRGVSPPACDVAMNSHTRWRLSYDIYQYFLPENDMTNKSFLEGMSKMSSVQKVEQNGLKITTITSSQQTILFANSYIGIGVIYGVIVRDPLLNTSANYLPVPTYACRLTSEGHTCQHSGSSFICMQVICTAIGLYGLILCFFGHRIFEAEFFFFGFLIFGFVLFVLLTRLSTLNIVSRLIITVAAGVMGGFALSLVRWRFGVPVLCVLLVGLALGFLVAAIVAFTPLANFTLFRNDFNFWMSYVCVMLVVPTVLLPISKALNIITCALVGSYAVIVAVGVYIYTSLTYIILNIIKRAIYPDFAKVSSGSVPFQLTDYVLTGVWALLFLCGLTLQFILERNKPYFPPCPYDKWKKRRNPTTCGERTPLLHAS
ncbi:transmembrane 7 superfamily member 3 [Callorhinchus milii]|uniref:transmembrane 7 superfamily member 3 n=1 Tax=Callorhinchus milii TaxID=7868 RepID=UPI001C3FEBBC|nr:transmembrane 7 superfamily member 3 [Callorhinchus milii]